MFDKTRWQHLAELLLISKIRNLANDVSHDQSVLTVKIFGATTTQHFPINISFSFELNWKNFKGLRFFFHHINLKQSELDELAFSLNAVTFVLMTKKILQFSATFYDC
jgi:hypothetical protein